MSSTFFEPALADELCGLPVILRIARLDKVQWEGDRVEIKTLQGLQVNFRGIHAMTGDADMLDQAVLPGFHQGLQRPTAPGDGIQLIETRDGMQLVQVKSLALQAFERLAQFVPGPLT